MKGKKKRISIVSELFDNYFLYICFFFGFGGAGFVLWLAIWYDYSVAKVIASCFVVLWLAYNFIKIIPITEP